MALPQMTPEQREAALAKAAQVRKDRAQIKADLKAGNITIADVLARKDEDLIAKIKVFDLLKSLPRIGATKAANLMENEFKIAANRKARGLGARQIREITQYFDN